MKKEVILCDRCGKDISRKERCDFTKRSHIDIELVYWHGGSMGGSEDIEKFSLDLCEDCAKDLAFKLTKWINEKK